MDAGWLWSVMTVVGPMLLGAALVHGVMRSRKRSQAAKEASDRAAVRLQREGAREERRSESPPTQL
jgi:hypothetical protein